MATVYEAWSSVETHLHRAHALAGAPLLDAFHDHVDHHEFEFAADVLMDFADERTDLPRALWDNLMHAYWDLELDAKAKLCRSRIYEAEHGFVEAQLFLRAAREGGRLHPIFTDYRANWDVGNVTPSGETELNGAPITLEDAQKIAPGSSGRVRLHPVSRAAFRHLRPGDEIVLCEGASSVGYARVLRVTLR